MQQTFDYWSPAIRSDPYPLYHAMLAEGPVHPDGDDWVVVGHAEVQRVFTDPSMSAVRGQLNYLPEEERRAVWPLVELNQAMMLFSDPGSHTRLRGLVAQAFSAKMIESMRPRIASIVTGLLDGVADAPEWDIIETVANPLPGRGSATAQTLVERLRGLARAVREHPGRPRTGQRQHGRDERLHPRACRRPPSAAA
jgi:cytochrome P450